MCTELRHRAEQADLEAQLGMPGTSTDRADAFDAFYQARATRERKPWSQFVFEHTRDGSRCSHKYSCSMAIKV